eukprot:TRINITY_DN6104_c0_g1_i1.p1 TRINITY_DN6104_c0_g1~~TRINITY_DN6104_c0_g1_i1.p1  ORF type:complete len:538 (-),score=64.10 TRINITY_DN6104_c0_g1_i1:64-1677(-)
MEQGIYNSHKTADNTCKDNNNNNNLEKGGDNTNSNTENVNNMNERRGNQPGITKNSVNNTNREVQKTACLSRNSKNSTVSISLKQTEKNRLRARSITPQPKLQKKIIQKQEHQMQEQNEQQLNFLIEQQRLKQGSRVKNQNQKSSKIVIYQPNLMLHLENYMERKQKQYNQIFSVKKNKTKDIGIIKKGLQIPFYRQKEMGLIQKGSVLPSDWRTKLIEKNNQAKPTSKAEQDDQFILKHQIQSIKDRCQFASILNSSQVDPRLATTQTTEGRLTTTQSQSVSVYPFNQGNSYVNLFQKSESKGKVQQKQHFRTQYHPIIQTPQRGLAELQQRQFYQTQPSPNRQEQINWLEVQTCKPEKKQAPLSQIKQFLSKQYFRPNSEYCQRRRKISQLTQLESSNNNLQEEFPLRYYELQQSRQSNEKSIQNYGQTDILSNTTYERFFNNIIDDLSQDNIWMKSNMNNDNISNLEFQRSKQFTPSQKIQQNKRKYSKEKLNTDQKFLGLSLIHISEPTRLGMISYAVFCLKKKKKQNRHKHT